MTIGEDSTDVARAHLAEALDRATKAGQWAIASRILAQLEDLGGAESADVVSLDARRGRG